MATSAFPAARCQCAWRSRTGISWNIREFPSQSVPAFLPTPLAHIDASGGLCYLARGSVVLDRYAPAGALALCLDEAEKVLERMVSSSQGRQTDVEDEFLAYWGGGRRTGLALIGNIDPSGTIAECSAVDLPKDRLEGARVLVISTNPAEVESLAKSVSGTVSRSRFCPVWIFRSKLRPVAPESRLPTTVTEVFKYLRYWDPTVYGGLQKNAREKTTST